MKKYFQFCVISLMALLSSCSKTEEVEITDDNSFRFQEPVLLWGSTQQEIMNSMSDYDIISSSPATLIYKGKESEVSILYAFSSLNYTLSHVVVSFDLDEGAKVRDYMGTHYNMIRVEGSASVYSDPSNSMYITLVIDDMVYVTYMDTSYVAR